MLLKRLWNTLIVMVNFARNISQSLMLSLTVVTLAKIVTNCSVNLLVAFKGDKNVVAHHNYLMIFDRTPKYKHTAMTYSNVVVSVVFLAVVLHNCFLFSYQFPAPIQPKIKPSKLLTKERISSTYRLLFINFLLLFFLFFFC